MILHPSRHRHIVSALLINTGVVGATLSLAFGPAMGSEPDSIPWRGDYAGALEEATASDRLLWIQFTGPWCSNCARMERGALVDAAMVRHARESFVPLKLRCDEHEELALSFDLSGLPATVIVAPSREVVAVRQGYLAPDELDSLLREALAARQARDGGAEAGAARSRENSAESAQRDSRRPKSEARIALSGYCPVTLVSGRRLVPGQIGYTVQHEGRLYRFADLVTRNVFRRDPERYAPVNHGDCPVSQMDRGLARAGDPRWGVLYQGRLFLCATEDERQRFLKNPGRYAMVDVAEQGFCPHCLDESGLLVRGDPRFGVTREGWRYWFPNPSHRDAFLAESGTGVMRR
jgi:hypothetical protein